MGSSKQVKRSSRRPETHTDFKVLRTAICFLGMYGKFSTIPAFYVTPRYKLGHVQKSAQLLVCSGNGAATASGKNGCGVTFSFAERGS